MKDTIAKIHNLKISKQVKFCSLISQNITISIRSVLSYKDKSDEEKIKVIMLLNEFHHQINNISVAIEGEKNLMENINRIEILARRYANENTFLKDEIAAITRHSLQIINKDLEESVIDSTKSIFKLIETENFRKRTAMYLGEKKISLLEAVINGYRYALFPRGIIMEESEPKFDSFNDWIADYYNWNASTAGWKNIILKECDGNEENALNKFFDLYDEFKK